MEIIVHGKPNAGSFNATPGLDPALTQNIVDGFFQSMGKIPGTDILIVDARYWKGRWYSVYTYWMGKSIRDTADRSSYFALSMIVPGSYYCLVSEVYKILKEVCHHIVIGNYIAKDGKYTVQDFSDKSAFNRIVSFLSSNRFVNLEENFDSRFVQNSDLRYGICYNVVDCDSKAFVQALRTNGRVLVSPQYESKDARLSEVNKYIAANKQYQNELASKNNEIENLKQHFQKVRNQVDSELTEKDNKIRGLEAQISQLKGLAKDARRTDNGVSTVSVTDGNGKGGDRIKQFSHYSLKSILRLVPLANTALLILLIILVLAGKSCTRDNEEANGPGPNTPPVADATGTVHDSGTVTVDVSTPPASGDTIVTTDVDCGIKIFQDGIPVSNPDSLNLAIPFIIKVRKPMQGYGFHASNVKGGASAIRLNEEIEITPENPREPIIISYRSDKRENTNNANIITINPKSK